MVCLSIYLYSCGTRGKEPACQCRRHEMRVQSVGWEDLPEEEMATYSSLDNPTDREACRATVQGLKELSMTEAT